MGLCPLPAALPRQGSPRTPVASPPALVLIPPSAPALTPASSLPAPTPAPLSSAQAGPSSSPALPSLPHGPWPNCPAGLCSTSCCCPAPADLPAPGPDPWVNNHVPRARPQTRHWGPRHKPASISRSTRAMGETSGLLPPALKPLLSRARLPPTPVSPSPLPPCLSRRAHHPQPSTLPRSSACHPSPIYK